MRDGVRTLHHHAGVFYAWSGTRYPEGDDAAKAGEAGVFWLLVLRLEYRPHARSKRRAGAVKC